MFTNYLYFQLNAGDILGEDLTSKAKQSRSEKKARKAMSKLGGYNLLRYILI